jgi:hypothetical protein
MRLRIGVNETGLIHGAPCSATPNSAAATDQRSTIMAAHILLSIRTESRDYLAHKPRSQASLTSVLAEYPHQPTS